ncbi:zinc-finger double domain-containing protein [Ditylenchus destructor]|uniref:Zinc-finger double domain-containing protein n=1 Tax=Ditylenchus destructor TaxID=166010 RepID=A0AAD4NA42_9BILA|nr:zinc-finger double domain-containing protein [Ditylenchus destructor]
MKYFEEQSYSDFQYQEEHQKSKTFSEVTSPLPTKNCVADAGTNASDESGPGECASNILTPLPGVPKSREENDPSSSVDTNKEENDVDYGNYLSDIESSLSELSIDEEDNYQSGIGGVTPRKRRSMVDLSHIETPNKKANKSCNDITNLTDDEETKKLVIVQLEKEVESLKKKLAEALCTMNKYANDKSSSKPNRNPSKANASPNSGRSTRFRRKFISSEVQDGDYSTLEIDDETNPIEEPSSSTSNKSSRTTISRPNPAKGVANILTPFGWEGSRDGEEPASDQRLTPRQRFGKAFKPEFDEKILPTHVYALVRPHEWEKASSVEEKAKAIFYIGITEIPKTRFTDHKDSDPKIYYKSNIKEFAREFECWFRNQYQEDSDVDYGNDVSDIESSMSELSIDNEADYEIGIGGKSTSNETLTPRQRFGKAFKPVYDEETLPMNIYALVRPQEWEKASSVEEKAKAIFYIGLSENPTSRYSQHTRDSGPKVYDISTITEFALVFKCSECAYATSYPWSLKTHMRTHTGEKPFKCSLCSHTTTTSWDMEKHTRTHTKEKPYKCSECAFATGDSSTLQKHMRTHTGEKPYKCSECSYTTTTSWALNRHMRNHTGEKPYKCSQCAYDTGDSSALQKHMRNHTGEKTLKCSECSYACSYPSDFNKHIRTHTREKPFKCPECAFATSNPSNVKTHFIRKHQ